LKSLGALKEEVKAVNDKLDAFESFKTDILNQVEAIRHDVDAVKKEVQEKIVHDICALQTETIAVKKQGEEHEKSLNFINSKYDDMKKEFGALQSKNDNLKKVIDNLEKTVTSLNEQIDVNEQHNRSECLLLHGVPELEKEKPSQSKEIFVNNINQTLGPSLGVTMSIDHIRRAHRLGKRRNNGKPRPIIARIGDPELRNYIYMNKKECKGKQIAITENLTKRRMTLKLSAEQTYGEKNVWTKEGRIYAKDQNNQVKTIIA
jgi:archaellum component FlaC